LFFLRYEASQSGSEAIEAEHLLFGLLRESQSIFRPPVNRAALTAELRKLAKPPDPFENRQSTSVDLPLSNSSKRSLAYAAEEASRLGHRFIGTEHLLLGLLREDSPASRLVVERGLTLDALRKQIKENGPADADSPYPRRDVSHLAITPMAPETMHGFAYAMEAARAASEASLSPELLVFGLIHDDAGAVAQILKGAGVDLDVLRLRLRDRPPS
jgi:ATP-dependent Clp protease ATP-binding subunit ClpA